MPPTIREDCPCPNLTCRYHKLCDECEAAQAKKGGLPFCRRPKRSLWKRIKRLLGIQK